MYFKVCPYCGSHLGPGEKCECEKENEDEENRIHNDCGGVSALAESRGRL